MLYLREKVRFNSLNGTYIPIFKIKLTFAHKPYFVKFLYKATSEKIISNKQIFRIFSAFWKLINYNIQLLYFQNVMFFQK